MAAEALSFDSLALNDSTFWLVEVSCPPPRERPEWIGAADSEAQLLARTPLHENRDITVKVRVAPQTTKDLALDKVAQLVDKCVKASKNTDGIALTWTPADSTRTVTFDVLSAEIVDLPLDHAFIIAKHPEVTISMKAKPYWRGTETLTSTTSSSTPFVTAELVNNSGDVPALGRLIITDTATQSRRHVEWGLEGPLTYNAATSLLIDSDDMVVSGYAGALATTTGGYDPNAAGTNVVFANLTVAGQTLALAGVGNLSHRGTFRVKARMQGTLGTKVRLGWRVGDGPMSYNSYAAMKFESTWEELDLGTVRIPTVVSGTQRWTGQVESLAVSTGGVHIDYLVLVPVSNGYGVARATYAYQAGVTVGYDAFTSTTAGNNLNARVAPAGGTWATSGAATDFQFADDLSGEQLKRSTTAAADGANPRFAILGATNYTDTEVGASFYTAGALNHMGVIARWVDSSNYLVALTDVGTGTTADFSLTQVVAGVPTVLASLSGGYFGAGWTFNRLLVFASGRAILQLRSSAGGAVYASIEGSSSALATGGALASGKPGLSDRAGGVGVARYYDDFEVATPAAEPIVLYSGRNMQVRYDDTVRQDSTGTYTGRPQSYRGSRFLVPVGTSRVLAKAKRNDVTTLADSNVTDATQIQVGITPRGIAVPRS